MFIRRIIRGGENCIAGIVLLFLLVPVGMCQTTSDQEAEPASSDPVDEITVYGNKSIIRLRHEFYSAEEDFFDVYNTLNSNNDFDVDCDYVTFLGDRRRHHLCMPEFAKKEQANATADMLISGRLYDFTPEWTRVNRKDELLRKELATLILEHPEMRKAFNKLVRAKRGYESGREEQ